MNVVSRKIMGWASSTLLFGLLVGFALFVWYRGPQAAYTPLSVMARETRTGAEPCLLATADGFVFAFDGYIDQGNGTYKLSYRVTNPNRQDISYLAFGTVEWGRVEPADNSAIIAELGTYHIEWTNNRGNPGFTGVKYEPQFAGFSGGAADRFTLVVGAFDPATPIAVEAKAGRTRGRVNFALNAPNCNKTPPIPTPTSPNSPLSTPTSNPSQGIRVLPQRNVTLGLNEAGLPYVGFVPIRIEGEQLIGRGSAGTDESYLVTVDLNSGAVKRLSEVNLGARGSAAEPPYIYGDRAVRAVYAEYPTNTAIEVTNLIDGEKQITALDVARIGPMSFQDGTAAWQSDGYNVQIRGIYGYSLDRGELFPVQLNEPNRNTGWFSVCNADWISYLVAVPDPLFIDVYPKMAEMYQYEVWAFHYPTGDKLHLGMTRHNGDFGGYGLRCDSDHLVWLDRAADAAPTKPGYQLWHFDLNTRARRVLAEGVRGPSGELRIYDDILWNWKTVYDLRTGATVEAGQPTTGNHPYTAYLINDALVKVIYVEPVQLAIMQLLRDTP